MNATKTGLTANLVGLLLLWAAARGITVTPEMRELLIVALSTGGLMINQALIAIAQRQQAPAPRSGLERNDQAGRCTPQFAGLLAVFAMLAIALLTLPGCASLSQNVDQSKVVTQIAVMKVIEADNGHEAERAARIKEIAAEAQTFLDGSDVSVAVLADAVTARLAALDLAPSDRLLAAAMVDAVVIELNARVGDGLLSPEQKYTVSQVLGWVEQAAGFY